ncbi:MAG: ergothioneine biosynthesis protein EgtB [Candidatus Eisenbacteria bacterium]|nr:ergothioneine biosynthesis protein EgtB [Candidatus Latescibacterota bacterium]MBD3301874.1 ergothioneine biosynthesis protein EgtB [Candidatus Eisenbacteria bacterium]
MDESTEPTTTDLAPAGRLDAYRRIRRVTETLCEPLRTEDFVVQSMPDASPAKWHLGHTSWFFETFLLKPHLAGYEPVDPRYEVLFNSYYNTVGEQYPRPERGLLTRPTVEEVFAYRRKVDDGIGALLDRRSAEANGGLASVLEVGIHHEQQHQELLLTDLKHLFSRNPIRPVYRPRTGGIHPVPAPARFIPHEGGIVEIGHSGTAADGYSFDNERPRHRVLLQPFALADRPVTNGEFREFLEDGGYADPRHWLSDGWDAVEKNGWTAPLYWRCEDGRWGTFTLAGFRDLDPAEPVCHLSYYEADAYARWAGARLPTEQEWEAVAAARPIEGNLQESERLHPAPIERDLPPGPARIYGDVWEWTASAYAAYPGFRPNPGALGEYNGKFMCNQFVLRGGSCLTPRSHIRPTYRNFFHPEARWQVTGLRLAKEA